MLSSSPHFPPTFFQELQSRSGRWLNFWRATNPIATRMPGLVEADHRELPDPSCDGVLKVHGDYWIAGPQVDAVAQLLANPSAVPLTDSGRESGKLQRS